MVERESGFYAVRLSDSTEYTIMQYINGNGWHYPLPKPDAWIQEISDKVR